MTTHDRVRQQLHVLETLLREHRHWRLDAPQAHLFTSTQPFFMDTMEPLEWLQWVLIPRMHTLLDNAQPLPEAFAVAPYYEMALAADHPQGRRSWRFCRIWMRYSSAINPDAGDPLSRPVAGCRE